MPDDRISYLWTSHEDRLQDLEKDRVDTAAQLAEQNVTLKSIKEDICDLSITIKEGMSTTLAKLQEHIEMDNSRLSKLENVDKKEEKKTEWYRKLIYAIIIGGGGALASFLLQQLGD